MSDVQQSDMSRPAKQAAPTKAGIIIDLLGEDVVARLCRVERVQMWRYKTGRLPIPGKHHAALRAYATSQGIELPAELFVAD